jgi:antitoxin (DNA-binding transcriptional repressor) of toxin-antitoxin stability system
MKTVTIQQVPRDWAEILRWVVGGKEVQLTDQDKVVARLLPPEKSDAPDFVARAARRGIIERVGLEIAQGRFVTIPDRCQPNVLFET